MTTDRGHFHRRITVENTTDRKLTFILEPWANEYPIAPGERYVVEGNGPGPDADFTVLHEDDYVIVWAWDASDARVLREDGTVVSDWTGLRVPDFVALDMVRRDAR